MPVIVRAFLAATMLTACTSSSSQSSTESRNPGQAGPALSCAAAVKVAPLPSWARAGFTPPDQPVPQVLGLHGDILGVVFGDPLRAPAVEGHGNKILWLARPVGESHATVVGGDQSPDLKIHATLNGSALAVDRQVVGGPGPSIIDMPAAGCWTFALTWSAHHDSLAVPYSSS